MKTSNKKYNQPGGPPAQTESKMELQQGLNNVIRERIAKRIQTGSMNAKEAVQKLIAEGKVANDYIAYLGAKTPGNRKYYLMQRMQ